MFTILLHSSKTTRHPAAQNKLKTDRQFPALYPQAQELAQYLKSLTPAEIRQMMKLSESMAHKTHALLQGWSGANPTLPAIDLFLGDIYSGLQVQTFSNEDRNYANEHLFILSGLYGVLRTLDEIQPYRLEMGYKLPRGESLYHFWGKAVAHQLPESQTIINLSAVEYTKAVFPHLKNIKIISPKFLTTSPKTGEPTFVTVHAKVARGAFARWIIQNRIESEEQLKEFAELGYRYAPELSADDEPVFVAKEFGGIGLSVRLT